MPARHTAEFLIKKMYENTCEEADAPPANCELCMFKQLAEDDDPTDHCWIFSDGPTDRTCNQYLKDRS